MSRIDEIKERFNASTAGPWQKNGTGTIICDLTEDCQNTVISSNHQLAGWRNSAENIAADFEFIANSKEDISFLLGEIERLQESNSRAIGCIDKILAVMTAISTDGNLGLDGFELNEAKKEMALKAIRVYGR
jgi:hypothetical protein